MGGGMMGAEGGSMMDGASQAFGILPGQPGMGNQSNALGYLVSLDTQLPLRGDEYLFTTPRGATEITAQSISTDTLERWSAVGLILVGLLVWGAAYRLSNRKLPHRS